MTDALSAVRHVLSAFVNKINIYYEFFEGYFGTSWEQDIQIVIILFVWKIETNNKLWKYPKIKLLGHNKRMKVKKEILNNKRNYKLWRSLSIFVIAETFSRQSFLGLGILKIQKLITVVLLSTLTHRGKIFHWTLFDLEKNYF